MTYARARLYLGITGVGTMVLLAVVGLWADVPERWFGPQFKQPQTLASDGLAILSVLLAYIAVSLPLDVLGGWLLPARFGRAVPSFGEWLLAWGRGILVQAAVIGMAMATLLAAARWGGPWAMVVASGVGMLALLVAQLPLAELVGGLNRDRDAVPAEAARTQAELAESLRSLDRWGLARPAVTVVTGQDMGFTGGVVGLPGAEQIVLPARWVGALPTAVLAAELARRVGVLGTGSRLRGVLVAVGWNLAGLVVGLLATGADPTTVAGLLTVALVATLWQFLGLMILPSLSRPGVLEADGFARRAGVPAEVLAELIRQLDRRQDDEPSRPAGVEAVFHPLPCVSRRLTELAAGGEHWGAWHAARLALFLSWAGLGFLHRSVHCNAGRPELWVLLPSD